MKKHWAWLAGLAILAVGSYLRLTLLYTGTMGSDVMEFFKICQTGVSPAELMLNAPKHIGELPPLWFAAHNWFLQTFGLEATFGNVRLLDALTGILTILAAFGAGTAAGGRRTGLLTALFVALQPLHVQLSRECYFYSGLVLACFLGLWSVLRLAARLARSAAPDVGFYVLALSGFFVLTSAHTSSWSFAAVLVVAWYVLLIPAVWHKRMALRHLIGFTLALFFAGLPVLLSSWGLQYALSLTFGERGAYWANVFGEQDRNFFLTTWQMISSYLMGRGGIRTVASLLLLVGGIWTCARAWKTDRQLRAFASFGVGAFVLLAFLHARSAFPVENRHYSSLFPILAIGVSLGLVRWADLAAAKWKASPVLAKLPLAAPPVLVIALLGWPAWLSSQQDFSPPFRAISDWADSRLPPGSVVLCDRWFTPWNEFRINPSTNVTYTFTIPSEPIQTYTDSRWRDTAKQFFAVNPLAAFFEQKVYWARLGPWTWPQENFARQEVFEDKAAARLDAMGLYYRARPMDYPREWIPLVMYYNTEEDLVARAQQAGDRLLCLFGPGWQYTKTQDYRDWYVLQEEAIVVVHNLTAEPVSASVEVTGTAVQGPVTVMVQAGVTGAFQPNQIQSVRLGPLQLQPGRNEIRLRNLKKPGTPAALLAQRIAATEP
jgi:hypothetical protein